MQTLWNCSLTARVLSRKPCLRASQSRRQNSPSGPKSNRQQSLDEDKGCYTAKFAVIDTMRLKWLARMVRLVALSESRHDQCVRITRFCPIFRLFVNKQLSPLKVSWPLAGHYWLVSSLGASFRRKKLKDRYLKHAQRSRPEAEIFLYIDTLEMSIVTPGAMRISTRLKTGPQARTC